MTKSTQTIEKIAKGAEKLLSQKDKASVSQMLFMLASTVNDSDAEFFDPALLADVAQTHAAMSATRVEGKPQIKIREFANMSGVGHKIVIDIVGKDLAFLVDSVAAEINRRNILISMLLHPNLYVDYDEKGALSDISAEAADGYERQAHLHVQIHDHLSEDRVKELEVGLLAVLNDVYHANAEWQPMLAKLREASDELNRAHTLRPAAEIQEHCAFLEYLAHDNFTLLGYREYRFKDGKDGIASETVKNSSLGLLRDGITPAYISESDEGLPRNLQELRRDLPSVSVSKTNRMSSVHRHVPMDCIAIKQYDGEGKVVGEKLFLGLFTSVTYSRSVSDIPFLRKKVDEALEQSDFIVGSHNRRALRHILEKYPRDELLQIRVGKLLEIANSIIRLQERQRIALFMRKDSFGRYISCLVYVPRDRFGTKLRKNIQKILERETQGVCANFYTTLDDSMFARVMYVLHVSQNNPPKVNEQHIENLLQEAGQTWGERLSHALADVYEDLGRITDISSRYGEAFPVGYTSEYTPQQCVHDIENIETCMNEDRMILDLYHSDKVADTQICLKIFHADTPIILSDMLPILEATGLRAISELPFEVTPAGSDKKIWVHDFLLEASDLDKPIDLDVSKVNFEKAFAKIWHKQVEGDTLNRLVLSANANWHEITILRAYIRYLRQLRLPYSQKYMERALTDNPKLCRIVIDIFKAYHHPDKAKRTTEKQEKAKAAMKVALDGVKSSDYDRILRALQTLILATLRTNYFQRQDNGSAKTYLSLKFDSKKIEFMPDPKPYREIFVYSPRVEAVHLRGDVIARGGLRWSDRHEDYRTEVLGLMKAQMVKNAVIVPMGSKGGFVVKTETHSREEFHKEGVECYKTFIRGMLDITDNREGDDIMRPDGIICRDDEDPYLVVAADKGTARFSDIANGLSQDYGFWLDDAFASGGSAGYDHKVMGITARGGWESVKHHFRLYNHDIQNQPFDVVGVGDMGGDVFGNGMLLSEHIRLIGAFNHLHIFCDPDPDVATSYKERKRLFDAVKGWDEYDEKILSRGGRIYNRSDKMLKLTAAIKERFGLDKDEVTPVELMRAMLKSQTDLLWFGGIGTYIKSKHESQTDADDKANDAIRVDAPEIRAKVIGEGANLAITQAARIEMSQNGVKLNTDFLDNSGGVDSSDHEVNIKILLGEVMKNAAHKMDLAARNELLKEMTEEVAQHVLRHNYQQAVAISLVEMDAAENLQMHDAFIHDMEREEGLNRKIEGLPDQEEIEKRLREGKGLTRPELCVLLSYAKIGLTKEILASDIPDNPEMEYWITAYFPDVLSEKYRVEMMQHRLKREIIATMMANSLINRMGPTFLKSLMNKTGARVEHIVQAYIISRDAYGLRKLWSDIEAMDGQVPAQVQLKATKDVVQLAEHGITWFLTRLGRDMNIDKDGKFYRTGVETLSDSLEKLMMDDLKESVAHRQGMIESDGLPADLAHRIAVLPVLTSACDIIRMSATQSMDLQATAKVYFEVGKLFHFDWLRQQARLLTHEDHWHSEAAEGLLDQLYESQALLTVRILKAVNGAKDKSSETHVQIWLKENQHYLDQFDALFVELRKSGTIELTRLMVAEQRLRAL